MVSISLEKKVHILSDSRENDAAMQGNLSIFKISCNNVLERKYKIIKLKYRKGKELKG